MPEGVLLRFPVKPRIRRRRVATAIAESQRRVRPTLEGLFVGCFLLAVGMVSVASLPVLSQALHNMPVAIELLVNR